MLARRRLRTRKARRITIDNGFCETCATVCDGRCRARARREAQERAALAMGLRW